MMQLMFVVNGTINNTAVDDTTFATTPLGLDSSNNIVKPANNINNVAFGNVQGSFDCSR